MKYNQKLLKLTLLSLCFGLGTIGCGDDDQESPITNQPPVIEHQSFTTSESVGDETIIGTVTATDPEGDELTFSITENSGGLFEITAAGTLTLTDGQQLDFETADAHQLTISVSDGIAVSNAEVTINVMDENENVAPTMTYQTFEVAEYIIDTDEIGIVEASDANGDPLTFSITEDTDGLFEITEAGLLTLRAGKSLDYDTKTSHTITVQVTDGEANTQATVTVNVVEVDEASFITVWSLETSETVALPLYDATENTITHYDFTVDWGDGTSGEVTSHDDPDAEHTYSEAGEYSVTILGTIEGFNFSQNDYQSASNIKDVLQWGNVKLGNDGDVFRECTNLEAFSANDAPDLTGITDMSHMFYNAESFNGDMSDWDVSNVTAMNSMFYNANAFNQAIGDWEVGNVKDMSRMFYYAKSFNNDIGDWDVSNVTNMYEMFIHAYAFNQAIGNWDVSNVNDMSWMFFYASVFNQDISDWDVSNVTDMRYMFASADNFNQAISDWEVSNVTDMGYMFASANAFNQDLEGWDVSSVTDMSWMFYGARTFNQALNNWDVRNVTNMMYMFYGAIAFNQTISDWDVRNVTNMQQMFAHANVFNQEIGGWNVGKVTDMSRMFYDATVFDQALSNWNVSSVTDMEEMFLSASAFDQDLSEWDTSSVTDCSGFAADSPIEGTDKLPAVGCFE